MTLPFSRKAKDFFFSSLQFIKHVHFTIAVSNIYNRMKYECFYLQLCSQHCEHSRCILCVSILEDCIK